MPVGLLRSLVLAYAHPCLQIIDYYMKLLNLDEKCVKCALRTDHTTFGAFACGLQLQHAT